MRVVHFLDSFPALTETFIYNYVAESQRQGVDNHILAARPGDDRLSVPSDLQVITIPRRLHIGRISARVRRLVGYETTQELGWRSLRRRAVPLLNGLQPDVIHAHFGPAGVAIAPVAARLGIPLVVSFLGYDISRLYRDPWWVRQYEKLGAIAQTFIGSSHHIGDRLTSIRRTRARVEVIHFGIDLDRFSFRDPTSDFDGAHLRLVSVGRLVPKKDPLALVTSFAKARRHLAPMLSPSLTIAGDGPLMSDVRQHVMAHRLTDVINLRGAVSSGTVCDLMGQAHMYVQHSRTAPNGDEEGMGLTFVEASARGLPIVSTRHNGIPDVVLDGRTGYLVPEGDVDAMAQRIIELAENSSLWSTMGRAGRAHVEEGFSLDRQVARTVEVLAEAIQQHKRFTQM
jgi:colanic acid/amylovoran biosynthesis glycosyltransferase